MEADADAGEAIVIGVMTAAAAMPAAASARVTFMDLIDNPSLNSEYVAHTGNHELINGVGT
ncbi:hypothetical protein [Streptomyces sp. NPDC056169]|uniref:hypothetical protein n=1 Tax=Streptomyces sp. NPDC056169 TaxID=3345734 RepID=UPI0035D73FE5